ncbi:hypothetical protein BaRGS_00000051 [Batillaria attramentaria]|uniref:Coiled-coil domain-containing protein 148 n=1 Tax=Batillaria attramentaria TaxID=370345 RepID=A0ABD0MAS1_9CAEN
MAGRGSRAFTTSTYTGDTDHLVQRMVEGLGSNKYKPVDYGRLRALASEKKFAAIKTSMKVSKIEQISQANKESSLLKQHQLVWQKEFLRLQHIRRKVQAEVESHIRQNSCSDICCHIYNDFEYNEAGLASAFDAFKTDTADPVWNLRDDLRYWLAENREDLKLGDPDVIEKHAEIRDTVTSVKAQQADLLEKLRHEQRCLEQELDTEELRQLCPPVLEKHATVNEGIPAEAIEFDCPDRTLKATVLLEFLIIDEKYAARVDDLMARHALALKMDDCGGWDPDDHFTFVAVHDQYPRELPNRRSLLFDRLKRHLPSKSRSELSDHEDWWMDYKYLKERIKGVHNDWARDRRELLTKVKLTFQEAALTHQLEELRSENHQRQRQLCQALYDKVREWREKKMEAMEKEKHQKQEEEMQQRLEALQQELAEHAAYDLERVNYPLREQVRPIAERDPARTMAETEAFHRHHTKDEEHDYIPIQKPLFDVHSFTSKQITRDPRVRLETRLREAGLHNNEYARTLIAQAPPPQPPRKDLMSTFKFSDAHS